MEPAVGRRDDKVAPRLDRWKDVLLQWSPLLVGGMTQAEAERWKRQARLQWSPPLVGGMTMTSGYDDEWSTLLQWSPPLVGGMTSSGGARTPGISSSCNGARCWSAG